MLVCIALILGGNMTSQNALVTYMVQEDDQNLFLLTIKGMLQKYFELTKKFLTEKNAKLELIQKIKKQQQLKASRQQAVGSQPAEDKSEDGELLTAHSEEDEDQEKDREEDEDDNDLEEDLNIINCIRTLRFLQLLCEGHHKALQDHLREQKTKYGLKNP